jgi:predicted DNA-binding transcriptional regulator AlpA
MNWIGYAGMVKKLGVSRTQIQRWVAEGRLPKPLRLGTHRTSRTVWWEHDEAENRAEDDAPCAHDRASTNGPDEAPRLLSGRPELPCTGR